MADAGGARRVKVLAKAAIGVGLLLVLLAPLRAGANHPPSNVVTQNWDLLGTMITTAKQVQEDVVRGTLPGGTLGFDPQPSGRFEVVAKVAGAAGSGGWEASLLSGGASALSEPVWFGVADSTLRLRGQDFAWPAADFSLSTLRLKPVAPTANDAAGTITVQKAYLRIRQEGVIRRAVARVPVAGKQLAVTNTDWQDVADLGFYEHLAGDFSPAPTIRLRTSAKELGANLEVGTLYLRLVDSTGATVAGGQNVHSCNSWCSVTSGALTLSSASRYKLQVRVDVAAPPQKGDLGSAEIVLEHATADAHGLSKTVGFYPGVTAGTDAAAPADLGFLLSAPEARAPAKTATFSATIGRVAGAGAVRAVLRTNGSDTVTTGGTQGNAYLMTGPVAVPTLPAPGAELDTKALPDAGTTGRISQSLLRIALSLRDVVLPTVSGFGGNPTPFSPGVSPGTRDATTLSATLSDDYSLPVSWTLQVKTTGGTPVRTGASGSGSPMGWDWDGRNDAGSVVVEATYRAWLTATDAAGNAAPAVSTDVVVDKSAPTISLWSGSFAISPNGDGSQDSAWLRATLTDLSLPIAWKVEVRNKATGALVRSSPTQSLATSGTLVSWEWNGQDDSGTPVPDATYTYAFVATDAQALSRTSLTADIVVDRVAPTLLSYTATPDKVSPNADGVDDLAVFDAAASESVTHTIRIVRQATGAQVKTITASGTTIHTTWNGRDTAGVLVPEGTYVCTLTISDAAGNKVTASTSQWIDGWAPAITGPTLTEAFISPNGDGRKDTTVVGATLADGWAPISWTIEIKNAAGALVRSFSGAGSGTQTQVVVSQSWDGKDNAGILAPDGAYTVSISATDGGATRGTKTGTVTLDTAAPDFDPRTLTPAEVTNTIYSSQPLLAKVSDPLAGLDLSTLTFTRHDETAGATATFAGAAVSWNATTQWAKATPPDSLASGHIYRLEFSALDRAGNLVSYKQQPASEGGGFLATTIALNGTMARIPPTQCVLSDRDIANDIQKATCTNVPLSLDATSVTWGGTKHADIGYVEQEASLASAQIKHGLAASGAPLASMYAYQIGDPAWGPRTVSMRYEAPGATSASTTYTVPAVTKDIGTLVTWVPAGWTAAYLEMDGQFAAAANATHGGCPDPSIGWSHGSIACSTDPLRNRFIVRLQDWILDPAATAATHAVVYDQETRFVYDSALKGYAAEIPQPRLQGLLQDAAVHSLQRDGYVLADSQTAPTGVSRIKAATTTAGGTDILVAVLDTGVDVHHPDLATNIAKTTNCLGTVPLTAPVEDLWGHGTHVAGIIASIDNDIGYRGVAPEAKIWAIKVFADPPRALGGCVEDPLCVRPVTHDSMILCGINVVTRWSPGKVQAGETPIRVANMSFGGPGRSDGKCGEKSGDSRHDAICMAYKNGVVLVASAGNNRGLASDQSPAAYEEVMTVSNLIDTNGLPCGGGPQTIWGKDDTFNVTSNMAAKEHFLSYGQWGLVSTEAAAPGTLIMSTAPISTDVFDGSPDGYKALTGTSQAAPHVAGWAALYLEGSPTASPAQVYQAMKDEGEVKDENFRPTPTAPRDCAAGGVSHTRNEDSAGPWNEPVVRADRR